eukprot:Pgem_evm1s10798
MTNYKLILVSKSLFLLIAALHLLNLNVVKAQNYTIGLKTLIITSDLTGAMLPENTFKAVGGSYDLLQVTEPETFLYPNGLTGT